jgi:hypothetical protein
MENFMERLLRITQKRIAEMNDEEKAFLRARQSYLNDAQLETYKEILQEKVETSQSQPTESKDLSYRELQKVASEKGMGKTVGKTKEELEKFIEEN